MYCFYALDDSVVLAPDLSNVERNLLKTIRQNKGFIAVNEERFPDLAELALESLVHKGYIVLIARAYSLLKVG